MISQIPDNCINPPPCVTLNPRPSKSLDPCSGPPCKHTHPTKALFVRVGQPQRSTHPGPEDSSFTRYSHSLIVIHTPACACFCFHEPIRTHTSKTNKSSFKMSSQPRQQGGEQSQFPNQTTPPSLPHHLYSPLLFHRLIIQACRWCILSNKNPHSYRIRSISGHLDASTAQRGQEAAGRGSRAPLNLLRPARRRPKQV